MRELLIALEGSGVDLATALAYAGGADVDLDADETRAAVRRAELLLAAGGDPHRELESEGRAVTALAADLDSAPARAALRRGLEQLAAEAGGLPEVAAALAGLLADEDRAWQAFACALLADALAGDD